MDAISWLEELEPQEENKTATLRLGKVEFPPSLCNLAGVEVVVRKLNQIVIEEWQFQWRVLYGLYYG